MYIVLLRFAEKREKAGQLMEGHKAWIRSGFDDGVFLLSGGITPNLGGVVVADGASLAEIESRVNSDPLVAENVVSAEILEVAPSRADERLGFLLG